MEKINKLIKKLLDRDVILYIIFGILTTLVNFVTFYILNSLMKINANISNLVAIPLAILFAYFTNRKWVFHTKQRDLKKILMSFVNL